MTKNILLIFVMFQALWFNAQVASTFENISVSADSFLNGSTGERFHQSGEAIFPILFEDFGTYTAWSGFAISNMKNDTLGAFSNQYSAIAGEGANGSENYAVVFGNYDNYAARITLTDSLEGDSVLGVAITNSTWAALDMQNGSSFSKKFGGATGDDPDFFKLTFLGFDAQNELTDSVEFYLADFRFTDNQDDYILRSWQWVDLKPLGVISRLETRLLSTDVGSFGINTPAYFCMDSLLIKNATPTAVPTVYKEADFNVLQLGEQLHVFALSPNAEYQFFSLDGKRMESFSGINDTHSFSISHWATGIYVLTETLDGIASTKKVLIH